jgi:hypothetical protein
MVDNGGKYAKVGMQMHIKFRKSQIHKFGLNSHSKIRKFLGYISSKISNPQISFAKTANPQIS